MNICFMLCLLCFFFCELGELLRNRFDLFFIRKKMFIAEQIYPAVLINLPLSLNCFPLKRIKKHINTVGFFIYNILIHIIMTINIF